MNADAEILEVEESNLGIEHIVNTLQSGFLHHTQQNVPSIWSASS